MKNNIIITVLDLERILLEDELKNNNLNYSLNITKGFDGFQYAEYLINASTIGAVALFLKYWIEKRKFLKISYNGKEFQGYTKSEVEDILKLLKELESTDKEDNGKE